MDIICGNPNKITAGSTTSSFVLPFKYKLSRQAQYDASLGFYNEIRHDDLDDDLDDLWIQRKRYFTPETSRVLFEKTKRFSIDPSRWETDKKQLDIFKDYTVSNYKEDNASNNTFDIGLLAPEIILFEVDDNIILPDDKSNEYPILYYLQE